MAVTIGISITQNSQSIENNTSNVTVKVTAKWTYGSWNATGKCYGSITIDGVKYSYSGIKFNTGATTSGSQTIMTKTANVNHNADGSKTLSCSASFYTGLDTSGTQKASASKELTKIPRATTPTISGSLSLGSSITIDMSNRASSGFTHNLYFSWGSQVIDSLIASGVATSQSWTIPKYLAEYIQAGPSGTMFLKCVTYSGSTEIGQKTLTLTITVPDTAEFRPTIQSISAVDANSLPLARYIVGKSQLKFTISAVGGYVNGSSNRNSYLKSAAVVVDGVSYPVTLGVNAASTFEVTTNLIAKAGTLTATVSVTDSRERTVSKEFTYTAYDYFAPEINTFKAQRCLADGTLNESGTYVFFDLKTTIASVGNLNAKTYKIVYENNGSEKTLTSGTLSAYEDNVMRYNSYAGGVTFSVDYSWVVRVYVYDSFNSSSPAVATVIVPTEATFMDWRTNGKGWAFGKVSTRDALECAWPIYDRFETLVTNGMAWYTGSGDSAVDPNTTKENLIVTDKNVPIAGFWYVATMFYSTKSDTANRVQVAYPYSLASSIYTRYYYNGAWSKWSETPSVVEAGTSGIWNYRKMANGDVELWGTYSVSNLACTTALGNWYRTPVFTPDSFPFTVSNPKLIPSYESDGYGAMLWATTTTTTAKPSSFYLIRPTSATITSGKINMHVMGKWK